MPPATRIWQENGYISDWEKLLTSALSPGGYERLAWHSLRAIHLVLYAGRRFRRQVVNVQASAVATGIGNIVGNKVGTDYCQRTVASSNSKQTMP